MFGKSYLSRPLFRKTLLKITQLDQIKKILPLNTNLLAVSKGHTANSIKILCEKGQVDFGESRLQEALPKINILNKYKTIRWHFIGRLQSNKVRGVVKAFDCIHSVDSLALAERISRIAGEENQEPKILFQIKFYQDPSKGGFTVEDFRRDWPVLIKLPNVELIGLMAISPIQLDLAQRKILFRHCRDLANEFSLKHCSMGMSDDWKEAVACGSTWIRIGSLLFGEREFLE